MDNLILTGYGWTEYAVAAAIALKGLGGLADVAGVSKRRLPELLEATAKGVRKIASSAKSGTRIVTRKGEPAG